MLSRLETLVLLTNNLPLDAIRRQIASGADILVHLGRLRDRTRRVLEIAEVDGMKDGAVSLHLLYRFDDGAKELRKVGALKHTEKLERRGLVL